MSIALNNKLKNGTNNTKCNNNADNNNATKYMLHTTKCYKNQMCQQNMIKMGQNAAKCIVYLTTNDDTQHPNKENVIGMGKVLPKQQTSHE